MKCIPDMKWSFAGLKLQTRQFNLSGMQANGTRYSFVAEDNLVQKGLVIRG
jgi:hypothetical protein